ncbi:hypothetical protein [Bremerella sp.]|uniref:hypothetical protein n=1 Tax=Bremerella sp. TaxID=2795602 RepID=UPI00391CCA18
MRFRKATGLSPLLARDCLEQLTDFDPEAYVAMVEDADGGVIRDPIESDPVAGPLVERVLREVESAVSASWPERKSKRGMCHRIWDEAKQRLLVEFGIRWRTPQELNPWRWID